MEQLVVGAAVIAAWVKGHRCLVWTILGVVTGCAAYAQDVAPAVAMSPSDSFWLEVIRAGGLPAVLGMGGYFLSRGGVPVVVRVSDEDRKLLERLADRDDERRGRR